MNEAVNISRKAELTRPTVQRLREVSPARLAAPIISLDRCAFYSTTTPNRNVRNSLKTNGRCPVYSTEDRGGLQAPSLPSSRPF